jgi:hypothetical protein
MLTLVLATTAFACGDVYTEVPQTDYATTMAEFVGEETTLQVDTSKNFRTYAKISMSAEGQTQEITSEIIKKGEGSTFELLTEVKVKENGAFSLNAGVYAKDGYFYVDVKESTAFGLPAVKTKSPYVPGVSELGVEFLDGFAAMTDYVFDALDEIDLTDAEFIASIGKLEVSGKAGSDRKLRITVDESDVENGITGSSTIILAFNKDGALTSISMTATTTITEDGASATTSVEVVIEKYSKNIGFPSFSSWE